MTGCSEKQRSTCLAWTSFKDNLEEMEDIQCWIMKGYASEGECLKNRKCKKCNYYLAMNRNSGIASEIDADTTIITCEGTLNNDSAGALERVWENLKKNGKYKVILDISRVNNIYSCGLGMLVRIHKEAIEGGGALIVAGARGYAQVIFTSTKLAKIIHLVPNRIAAVEYFEQKKKKKEEAERLAAEEAKKAQIKKRVPCYKYWNNQNPRNATKCDECFRKLSDSTTPCWIVEGMIEGISFQYVNEDCESCKYFLEFGQQDE